MKVEVSYLQKTECFPCTRREAKATFGDLDVVSIGLGCLWRHFRFDSRCRHRPDVAEQHIVAEAGYGPDRKAHFSAYVVREDAYPLQAREDFRDRVLPEMRQWLQTQIAKLDTATLNHEYLIVEWDGTTHQFHRFTWH